MPATRACAQGPVVTGFVDVAGVAVVVERQLCHQAWPGEGGELDAQHR